jgi:hypothetical protein
VKLSVVVAIAVAWIVAQPAAQAPTFAQVLRRAHEYVVIYEDHELSTVLAEEHYHQEVFDARGRRTRERTLRSDFLIFQLPPEEDWFALRDVYEVDGEVVGQRLERAKRLFSTTGEVGARAMEMAEESARFNIGTVIRTINVPTFPLRFLRPASRARFVFDAGGMEEVGGVATWIVSYRETKSPTFTATPEGRNVPARGRFWVEPQTGAIVRSELIMGGTRRVPTRATITVTYRRDERLDFWVPVEMRERYDNPRAEKAEVVTGTASYSSLRPFDWRKLAPPKPAPPPALPPADQFEPDDFRVTSCAKPPEVPPWS